MVVLVLVVVVIQIIEKDQVIHLQLLPRKVMMVPVVVVVLTILVVVVEAPVQLEQQVVAQLQEMVV